MTAPRELEAAARTIHLALLRLDAERAEIWLDGSSLVAGVRMPLGVDPMKDYRDKVAEVELSRSLS